MSLAMRLGMQRTTFASILAGIGISFSLFVPRAAEACWTCNADSECPTGFTCDESIGCMPTVDCQTDGDCGAGMRCVTETATECTATDSADGSPSTADSTCHTVNACAPIWQAGCVSDSDCGDGFSCVQNGSLCNSKGCTTLAQCQAKVPDISCNTDSDCPSCWSCLDASESGDACINPGGPADVNGTIASPPDPADASPTSTNGDAGNLTLGGPAKTYSGSSSSGSSSDANVCRPPYWGLSVNYAGPPPSAPVNSSTSNLCPNIEATRSGYTGVDPKSGSEGSGGCSIGATQGSNDSAPLWALGAAIAGLAVISRRKRAAAKS